MQSISNIFQLESLVHIALEELCECRPRYICGCACFFYDFVRTALTEDLGGVVHTEKFFFSGAPSKIYTDVIRRTILQVLSLV